MGAFSRLYGNFVNLIKKNIVLENKRQYNEWFCVNVNGYERFSNQVKCTVQYIWLDQLEEQVVETDSCVWWWQCNGGSQE